MITKYRWPTRLCLGFVDHMHELSVVRPSRRSGGKGNNSFICQARLGEVSIVGSNKEVGVPLAFGRPSHFTAGKKSIVRILVRAHPSSRKRRYHTCVHRSYWRHEAYRELPLNCFAVWYEPEIGYLEILQGYEQASEKWEGPVLISILLVRCTERSQALFWKQRGWSKGHSKGRKAIGHFEI